MNGSLKMRRVPKPKTMPDCIALLPADADTKLREGVLLRSQGSVPIFAPGGAFLAPGIVDPIESAVRGRESEWHPNSVRTRLLVGCSSAVKDIETLAGAIDVDHPWARPRPIALLATPLLNLCDHVKTLSDRLGRENEERACWPQADRDMLMQAARRLKAHQRGPLRLFRHERTAHVDLDVLRLDARRPEGALQDMILPPLVDSLFVLTLCMNYRRIYTWLRRPRDAEPDEVEIMTEYPLAIRARLDAEGYIVSLGERSFIAEDPRAALRDTVLGLFDVYNWLASAAFPAHPTIFARPTDET